MNTTLTHTQATLLAQLVDQLNPAWDMPGIWKAFTAHKSDAIPFAHLAVAAVTCAADPANHERGATPNTPERIWFPGPHWPTAAKASLPAPRPCPDHPEEHAHNCVCCAADILAGDRPRDMAGKHHQPATANEGQPQQAA